MGVTDEVSGVPISDIRSHHRGRLANVVKRVLTGACLEHHLRRMIAAAGVAHENRHHGDRGCVGGYFGARLAAAGEDVHFIARGAHLAALRANGLTLKSAKGDLHL
jgi:Ketopantoate reductase PanE/ApbA